MTVCSMTRPAHCILLVQRTPRYPGSAPTREESGHTMRVDVDSDFLPLHSLPCLNETAHLAAHKRARLMEKQRCAMVNFARHGRLEALHWARAQDPPWDWDYPVCNNAAFGGHLEVLVCARPEVPLGQMCVPQCRQGRPPGAAAVGARPGVPLERTGVHLCRPGRPPEAAAVGARPGVPLERTGVHQCRPRRGATGTCHVPRARWHEIPAWVLGPRRSVRCCAVLCTAAVGSFVCNPRGRRRPALPARQSRGQVRCGGCEVGQGFAALTAPLVRMFPRPVQERVPPQLLAPMICLAAAGCACHIRCLAVTWGL